MKVNGVNKNNIINLYKSNKSKPDIKKVAEKKDSLELSSAGKSLSSFSMEGNLVNSKEKIESIRNQVMQGTYKVDSSLTAKRIIDAMKGRDI